MAVVKQHSPVNFQFTVSSTPEVSHTDVRVKVYNPFVKVRYNETAPFQSVGLGFVALPDLTSRENVVIRELDYYPRENRPGVDRSEVYTATEFDAEMGRFLVTDIFKKQAAGADIPLYLQHIVTITTDLFIQTGSDVIVLDGNFDPVDPNEYAVWEGSDGWYIFHNLSHSYDALTGDYEAYYVSYPIWDSVGSRQREHVELLDPVPRFHEAEEDDYDETFEVIDSLTRYTLEDNTGGDAFTVHVTYDIETYSPMSDLYFGGGTPTYVYSVLSHGLQEIGPLYPKSLLQGDPWFPVLTSGIFYAIGNRYLISEYSQQPFMPYEPYKRVVYEEAILLAKNLIKTQHSGYFVSPTEGYHMEILIFDEDDQIKWAISTDTTQEYYIDAVGELTSIAYDHDGIASRNDEDGLIDITYTLMALSDKIYVSYFYVETDFEYTQTNLNPIYFPTIAEKSIGIFLLPSPPGEAIPTYTVFHILMDEADMIVDGNAVPGAAAIADVGNLSHGTVLTNRGHTDTVEATWYVEIVTGNSVPGTITDAEYRLKKGTIGGWSVAYTMTEDWISLGSGMEIKFVAATAGVDFYTGDIWAIEVEANLTGVTDDIFDMSYDEFLENYCLPTNIEGTDFLVVALYSVGSNRGLHDINLVDTRVRGGGVNPDLLAEVKGVYPEVDWFFDIGHYDGKPFPGAAAILVDLPADILNVNGGIFTKDQIDSIVKHHLSLGVYPVVRYYCTNTGLVGHETVPRSPTNAWNWVVDPDSLCPDPDGLVICQEISTTTTTTSTTTTSSTASTASTISTTSTTASTISTTSSTASTSSTISTTSSTTSTSTTASTISTISTTSTVSSTSSTTTSTYTTTSSSTTSTSSSTTSTTRPGWTTHSTTSSTASTASTMSTTSTSSTSSSTTSTTSTTSSTSSTTTTSSSTASTMSTTSTTSTTSSTSSTSSSTSSTASTMSTTSTISTTSSTASTVSTTSTSTTTTSSSSTTTTTVTTFLHGYVYYNYYDASEGEMWIRRARLPDFSAVTDIAQRISTTGGQINLAVDYSQNYIFFCDDSKIKRCDLGGGNLIDLFTGFVPRGLGIDRNNQWLYYWDDTDQELRRCKYDGSLDEILLDNDTDGLNDVFHIAVDHIHPHVYFGGSEDNQTADVAGTGPRAGLYRCDLDGGNFQYEQEVGVWTSEALQYGFCSDFDDDHFYYPYGDEIRLVDVFDAHHDQLMFTADGDVGAIAYQNDSVDHYVFFFRFGHDYLERVKLHDHTASLYSEIGPQLDSGDSISKLWVEADPGFTTTTSTTSTTTSSTP